jgi:hypothetical protein
MKKRPPRFFKTLADYQEMTIGDELHRVLADDIDKRVIPGSINHCAIAVDLWDDRPAGCVRRPEVMVAKHRYDVSVWPEPGLRMDFCFYNDAVTQITELSDMRVTDPTVKVGGLNYGLRLKRVVEITPSTKASRMRDKVAREVRGREYDTLLQGWILGGREGPEPQMPHHLRTKSAKPSAGKREKAKPKMSARLAALEKRDGRWPHVDVHEEMRQRKEREADERERERRRRERARIEAKRQGRRYT